MYQPADICSRCLISSFLVLVVNQPSQSSEKIQNDDKTALLFELLSCSSKNGGLTPALHNWFLHVFWENMAAKACRAYLTSYIHAFWNACGNWSRPTNDDPPSASSESWYKATTWTKANDKNKTLGLYLSVCPSVCIYVSLSIHYKSIRWILDLQGCV